MTGEGWTCGRGEANNRREPKWGGRVGTAPACAASLKENEGGGSFLCCLWATEGTPGSQRAAGAKIRYRGRKFATGGEISLL